VLGHWHIHIIERVAVVLVILRDIVLRGIRRRSGRCSRLSCYKTNQSNLISTSREIYVTHNSFLLHPPVGVTSMSVWLSVWLSVCLLTYQKPQVQISPNFLNVICGCSSSSANAKCYVLPVLWMTSCFHMTEWMGTSRDDVYVYFARRRHWGEVCCSNCILCLLQFNCICLATNTKFYRPNPTLCMVIKSNTIGHYKVSIFYSWCSGSVSQQYKWNEV